MKIQITYFLVLLFLFGAWACKSQVDAPKPLNKIDAATPNHQLSIRAMPNSTANFDSLPANIANYLPTTNEVLIDYQQADLNNDHLPDLLLVMEQATDTTQTDQNGTRQLYILLQQDGGLYKLAAQNKKVVYCQTCGGVMGDPYMGIAINNDGSFTVSNYGGSAWRWGIDFTFKYQNNDFFWIKETSTIFSSTDPEHGETKQRTETQLGKVRFNDFDSKSN